MAGNPRGMGSREIGTEKALLARWESYARGEILDGADRTYCPTF